MIVSATNLPETGSEERKAVRNRDEFISIASHELKTPLTSIQLSLELLKHTFDDSKETKGTPLCAETITKVLNISLIQLDRLKRLVNDLLDASTFQEDVQKSLGTVGVGKGRDLS